MTTHNMAANPLVSVITPNYNGSRYIERCVESVRLQNYSVEMIVVDDFSSDGSWEILSRLSEAYAWLIIVRLDENLGPVKARNEAIRRARGRFLAFLDIDDFWIPSKLSIQIPFMNEVGCALSFSDYRFVSENGLLIGRRIRGFRKIGFSAHHMTRYLGCLTIVLDRQIVGDFYFPEISPAYRAEDFLAWAECIERFGPAMRCPHDLARYSQTPNSRSSQATRVALSVWTLYRLVEKLPLFLSIIYFISYACSSFLKRLFGRPRMDRALIDKQFGWSIIG